MLKSDRWIRKMAHEQGMINPFSEKQVREGADFLRAAVFSEKGLIMPCSWAIRRIQRSLFSMKLLNTAFSC